MTVNDVNEATQIAYAFLQQYHDTINLKSAELQNGVWIIIFDVGFLSEQFKVVKIDAKTGNVLGYGNVG